MKKIIQILLLLTFNNLFSQIITENVNFNNYLSSTNNDLTNNFIFPISAATNFITQSNTGGVTGGALVPPNSVSWGNDVIRYCSTYKNLINSMIETSICFKYNSTLVNPNAFQRAITIWMLNDSSHDVFFHLDNSGVNLKAIIITGYNYTPNPPAYVNLVNGHWYKFVAQYVPVGGSFGDEVSVKAEVFDLGLNGVSIPTSIGNHTATIYDIDLVSANKYILGISGAKWGGAEYIDNFTFKGEKQGSICSGLDVNENIIEKDVIKIYPNPTKDKITIDFGDTINIDGFEIQVFNSIGQKIFSNLINKQESEISLENGYTKGIYYMKIIDKYQNIVKVKKIILQ